jgi:hypothetical protein
MTLSAMANIVLWQGMPLEEARATMRQIWEPNAIWQKFIDAALARGQSQ